jgi:predicted tellurium resistance membrane protein TerC
MDSLLALAADPAAWLALAALIAMEIVLGVDNLVFVAILSSKLPPPQDKKARRIGIGLSLIFRVLLVAGAAYIVHLITPLFTVFGKAFSWRDLILIAGGCSSSSRRRAKSITMSIQTKTRTRRSQSPGLSRPRSARSCSSISCSRSTASSRRLA